MPEMPRFIANMCPPLRDLSMRTRIAIVTNARGAEAPELESLKAALTQRRPALANSSQPESPKLSWLDKVLNHMRAKNQLASDKALLQQSAQEKARRIETQIKADYFDDLDDLAFEPLPPSKPPVIKPFKTSSADSSPIAATVRVPKRYNDENPVLLGQTISVVNGEHWAGIVPEAKQSLPTTSSNSKGVNQPPSGSAVDNALQAGANEASSRREKTSGIERSSEPVSHELIPGVPANATTITPQQQFLVDNYVPPLKPRISAKALTPRVNTVRVKRSPEPVKYEQIPGVPAHATVLTPQQQFLVDNYVPPLKPRKGFEQPPMPSEPTIPISGSNIQQPTVQSTAPDTDSLMSHISKYNVVTRPLYELDRTAVRTPDDAKQWVSRIGRDTMYETAGYSLTGSYDRAPGHEGNLLCDNAKWLLQQARMLPKD